MTYAERTRIARNVAKARRATGRAKPRRAPGPRARASPARASPVRRRRVAEQLVKGANGRVRTGKVLLISKKKPELVAMALRHGITGAYSKTKEELVSALYG